MNPLRFAWLLVISVSTIVPAQSNRAPIAQQRHPALPPNLSQMQPAAPFAQRRSKGFEATSTLEGNVLISGLNFAPAVNYDTPGYNSAAVAVAVADVNGDGKPDLLVVNPCANYDCTYGAVAVLLGNGDGTFQTPVSYDSGGYYSSSVAVADVNGDGKPDLVVANQCAYGTCANGTVSVLLGNGDGTFRTAVSYDSGGDWSSSVAVADVNGDGRPDVVVANLCTGSFCASESGGSSGTVGVLLGNGDGTFRTAVTYPGYAPISVAVADVSGDGKPDIVVANCGPSMTFVDCSRNTLGVMVLLGNGDGTFQPARTYGSGGGYSYSVAVADVNGDGKPDVVVANLDGTVGVLLGNGDGTFQTAVAYNAGGFQPRSVAVGDVNGDGKPDLVVANWCAGTGGCSEPPDDGSVGVLLGNGDGTFRTAVPFDSGAYGAYSIAVADVNGDSKPDLVVANYLAKPITGGGPGSVGVLINTTSTAGTWTLKNSSPITEYSSARSHSCSAMNVTAGDLLLSYNIVYYNGSTSSPTLTNSDTQGNIWTVIQTVTIPMFQATILQIQYARAKSSSSDTITVSVPSNVENLGNGCEEWSGGAASGLILDVSAGAQSSTRSTVASASAATAGSNDLVVGFCAFPWDSGYRSFAMGAGPGYRQDLFNNFLQTTSVFGGAGVKGNQTASCTTSGPASNWAAIMAAFLSGPGS